MRIFEQADMEYYFQKMMKEKDSLIAKYMAHTGLSPDEIVLVEWQTTLGKVFYPDRKSNHVNKEASCQEKP